MAAPDNKETTDPPPDNAEPSDEHPLARFVDPKTLREMRERYGEPRGYRLIDDDPPFAMPTYCLEDIHDLEW